MESSRGNVWKPIAIAAIIMALLLMCLLAALGCGGLAFVVRQEGPSRVEYSMPAPLESLSTPESMRLGEGATITYVEPDSPADQAGLTRGDVITAVDSQPVGVDQDLAEAIGAYQPGDTVTIEFRRWRTGQYDSARVRLGEHPDDSSRPYLGIEYSATPFSDEDDAR